QQTEIPVEAKLHQRDGRWLIYDIAVENVSLVANYRTQFDRIIRQTSYRELIARLRTKRQGLHRDSVAQPAPAS
ncbi:MAG: ABC transporter substrate-binding protein, partial [Candidatus Rokuibacteriota bacterium]